MPHNTFSDEKMLKRYTFSSEFVLCYSQKEWKGESYGTTDDDAAEEMERKQETKAADFMGIPAGWEDLAHERIWKGLLQECCLCFIL